MRSALLALWLALGVGCAGKLLVVENDPEDASTGILADAGGVVDAARREPTDAGVGDVRDAARDGVDVPETAPLRTLDLGPLARGVDHAFALPAGTLGFHVLAEGDLPFGIEKVTSPSGVNVFSEFTPQGGTSPTAVAEFSDVAAAAVPQSEVPAANPPEPGAWKVRVSTPEALSDGGIGGADGGAPVRVRVNLQVTSDAKFHGGLLDIHLYIPDGFTVGDPDPEHTVTASTAPTDLAIRARLNGFFRALSDQFGISRGQAFFHPADKNLVRITSEDQLPAGFGVSMGQPDTQALHVLLTNDILGLAWGIAPGIPGAVAVAGTHASGIIVASLDTPAEGDALTMLHELGHFVGLNHTSESQGAGFDPLSDTPQCAALNLEDPNTILGCADRQNLMFPAGPVGGTMVVSSAQKRVVQGSPLYRAFANDLPGGRRSLPLGPPPAPKFTRSGRPLSALEQVLLFGFCGRRALSTAAISQFERSHHAELVRASKDIDLPRLVRQRADFILTHAGP